MGVKFFNVNKRNTRLNNTVCLYEGEPVYVACTPSLHTDPPLKETEVYITHLPKKTGAGTKASKTVVVDYTDDKFSYIAFQLGYADVGQGVAYISRNPSRTQHAGLSDFNVLFDGDVNSLSNRLLKSHELYRCIKGLYTSFDEALLTIDSGQRTACAIDRYFAIEEDGNVLYLYYRTNTIGIKTQNREDFTIFPSKGYPLLKEELDRVGIKHRLETKS
jgi:hypothetical protein